MIWTLKINTFTRDKNDTIKRMFHKSVVAIYWEEWLIWMAEWEQEEINFAN